MTDSSKLHNPHARPRRIPARPVLDEDLLIRVVDRTAEGLEPRLLWPMAEPIVTGPKCGRHSIVYRCCYYRWQADGELHERDLYAETPAAAVERLCERLRGFDVAAVEIFAVRPPLTRDQVAAIQAANEELAVERQRLGICGDGEARERAIEKWLRSDGSVRSVGSVG